MHLCAPVCVSVTWFFSCPLVGIGAQENGIKMNADTLLPVFTMNNEYVYNVYLCFWPKLSGKKSFILVF